MILLENAIRYSPDRGTVRLGVARLGPQVELTVDDEGRGIAEGDRERIFEPFARVAEAPSGSGLGLAIAAQIVAAHGGRIEALEAPGGGARLRVALPLVARLDT
jgi:signal transduction histidine kinase